MSRGVNNSFEGRTGFGIFWDFFPEMRTEFFQSYLPLAVISEQTCERSKCHHQQHEGKEEDKQKREHEHISNHRHTQTDQPQAFRACGCSKNTFDAGDLEHTREDVSIVVRRTYSFEEEVLLGSNQDNFTKNCPISDNHHWAVIIWSVLNLVGDKKSRG